MIAQLRLVCASSFCFGISMLCFLLAGERWGWWLATSSAMVNVLTALVVALLSLPLVLLFTPRVQRFLQQWAEGDELIHTTAMQAGYLGLTIERARGSAAFRRDHVKVVDAIAHDLQVNDCACPLHDKAPSNWPLALLDAYKELMDGIEFINMRGRLTAWTKVEVYWNELKANDQRRWEVGLQRIPIHLRLELDETLTEIQKLTQQVWNLGLMLLGNEWDAINDPATLINELPTEQWLQLVRDFDLYCTYMRRIGNAADEILRSLVSPS